MKRKPARQKDIIRLTKTVVNCILQHKKITEQEIGKYLQV